MYWLTDNVWPTLEKKHQEPRKLKEAQTRANALGYESATTALVACKALLDVDIARRVSVETKLSTILMLTCITVILTLGFLLHLVSQGNPFTVGFKVTSGFLLYGVVQLMAAFFAALRGLSRRSELASDMGDVLPNTEEPKQNFLRRQLSTCLECLEDHEAGTCYKVSCMAVAQRALKNFSFALLGLVIALAALVYG